LTSLRESHKGADPSKQTIKAGNIVVVHDDVPRSRWQLAVIEELIEGPDGGIKAATIRTNTGKTNRPVTKLFPLEVNAVNEGSSLLEMIVMTNRVIRMYLLLSRKVLVNDLQERCYQSS